MFISRRRTAAGGFAQRHFDEVYRPWRRKMRLAFPLAVVMMVPPLLIFAIFLPHQFKTFVVFAAGCLSGLYLTLIDAPPEWIDRWRRGAEAERRTEKQLR